MATIKEKGTIAFMGEVQSGQSQSGNMWYRQDIVVDVAGFNGSFRKIALKATGNLVGDLQHAKVGDKVEVTYQVTAREWQGKWYNNVDLYKVEFEEPAAAPAPAYPQQMQQPVYPQQMQQQMPARRTTPQIPNNMPMDLQDGDMPF